MNSSRCDELEQIFTDAVLRMLGNVHGEDREWIASMNEVESARCALINAKRENRHADRFCYYRRISDMAKSIENDRAIRSDSEGKH